MQAIRLLAVAAPTVLAFSAATAQPTRHFKDSWFWGLKGGAMVYQVMSDTTEPSVAPMGGIDWVLTRTNGGLYVSYDHSFFNQFILVNDSMNPVDVTPGGRQVAIRGMHKFTMAGMLFPMQTYRLHPYIGFGATLSHIARAEAAGTYSSPTQRALVEGIIQEFRTVASPVVMFGAQLRLPFVGSAFVQATSSPVSDRFFLFTGSGWRSTVEAGMRYNVGTSIDRMR